VSSLTAPERLRPRLRERLQLRDIGLIGTRVDEKQQITLLHTVAFMNMQPALHIRSPGDGSPRCRLPRNARYIRPIRRAPCDGRTDEYFRRASHERSASRAG